MEVRRDVAPGDAVEAVVAGATHLLPERSRLRRSILALARAVGGTEIKVADPGGYSVALHS